MNKVRVLFLPVVDAENTNAQSLNVREIALRLDPERFQSTLWYECEPDTGCAIDSSVRLLQLPSRGRTPQDFQGAAGGIRHHRLRRLQPGIYLFLRLPRYSAGTLKRFSTLRPRRLRSGIHRAL